MTASMPFPRRRVVAAATVALLLAGGAALRLAHQPMAVGHLPV